MFFYHTTKLFLIIVLFAEWSLATFVCSCVMSIMKPRQTQADVFNSCRLCVWWSLMYMNITPAVDSMGSSYVTQCLSLMEYVRKRCLLLNNGSRTTRLIYEMFIVSGEQETEKCHHPAPLGRQCECPVAELTAAPPSRRSGIAQGVSQWGDGGRLADSSHWLEEEEE